jgi:hypothetical protein
MNFNKYNSCYICHRCLYTSFLKSDMEKHCNKKKICDVKYNCLLSLKVSNELSISKRYYFIEKKDDIPISELDKFYLIKLVVNYDQKLNIITENFESYNHIESDNNGINNENQIIIHEMNNENNKNEENDKNYTKNDYSQFIVYIDGIRHFKCFECNSVYKRKENLISHLNNISICENRKILNLALQKKDKKINKNNNTVINNIQNNNIQNNNNMEKTYNYKICDFVEDNYVHDHIPFDIIKNKDFFLYKNFLNLLLENDENKNIYFDNKYAFFYSDEGLKCVPSDRAGYVLLEKIDKALKSFMYSSNRVNNEEFANIERYYSLIIKKYKFDTIYRPYDHTIHKFSNCVTNNLRTRDKCLSDITQVLSKHKDKTKQIFKTNEYDKYEIDTSYKIAIEDYESERNRYKAFIDNGR